MRPRTAILAAMLTFLLVLNLPVTSAQADNSMRIDAELRLTSVATLEGSGKVTITLVGDAAKELRVKLINIFDDSHDQFLDSSEVRSFLEVFRKGIEGRTCWGITIDETTNFSASSESYITSRAKGLVSTTLSTPDPIEITVGIKGSGSGTSKIVQIAQGVYDTFAVPLESAAGYSFERALEIRVKASAYGIGTLTKPELDSGKISAVRLPWGSILWYSYNGQGNISEANAETLTFENFSLADSQLISFVVLFFGCFFILRTPGRRFDKFEKLHPRRFRKYAKPLLSVRLSAYILTAVLAILYFVPYLFSFASPTALLYGAYLYVLVPVALAVELVFSKKMYDKAALDIPEESVIEVKQAVVQPAEGEGEILCKICYRPIDAGLDMFQCSCGLTMHVDCAEKAMTCPNCGEPLVQLNTRSIKCRACGEVFLYSGDEDAYSIQCTKCGAFQEEIRPSKNYLIVDEEPRNAFMMIRAMGLSNRPAMCFTTSFPGKIRSDYDLKDVLIKWFSDSTTDIDNVNPKDLEGDAMEIVSTFLMTTREAGVLIDGIETLIELNGFDKTLAFIKKLNDLAETHGSTILLALNKTKVTPEQFRAINAEFDEVHDYQ